MPLDNDITNLNTFMPPPNFNVDEKAVEAPKVKGEFTAITDQLSTATQSLADSSAKLMNAANMTLPPPLFSRNAQGAVGGRGDPGGGGNPWLSPIPFVQISIAMLKFYETLRQSNLGMAKFENITMGLVMDMAKTQAKLIEHSAQQESIMAAFEAAAGAMAMAGATVGLGFAGKAHVDNAGASNAAKADYNTAKTTHDSALSTHTKSSAELKTMQQKLQDSKDAHLQPAQDKAIKAREAEFKAKTEFDNAMTNHSTQKNLESKAKLEAAEVKLDKSIEVRIQADKAFTDAKVQLGVTNFNDTPAATPVAGTTPSVANAQAGGPQPAAAPNSPFKAEEAQVKAKEMEVAQHKTDLDNAQAAKTDKKAIFDKEEQRYSTNLQTAANIGGMFNTLITQLGAMISSSAKSVFILEKGKSDAQLKIAEAQQQLLNKIMNDAQKEQENQRSVMGSTLQALMKIEDEHVRASTTTING
jgi:DNA-binding XRE family transcriptional regulator